MHGRWLMLLALTCLQTGCWWPRVVPVREHGPLFDSGFPLSGPAKMDAALCTLSSVGGDVTRLVGAAESLPSARDARELCKAGKPPINPVGDRYSGMVGEFVRIQPKNAAQGTPGSDVVGFLYRVPEARGVLILFSGLAMPPAGWINERFARAAASRGYASFALVRDESARPMRFDPVMEARRGLVAAQALRRPCAGAAEAPVAFVGISMGGLEALLAARDATKFDETIHDARAIVLDPVLDPTLVAEHLDACWRSVSVDAMQDFFRRILIARYGEPHDVSFREFLSRTRRDGPSGTLSDLAEDSPAKRLCAGDIPATIFLSSTDPVLGDAQRKSLDCANPAFVRRDVKVPGHIPLACDLDLFQQMIAELPAVRPR